MMIFEVQTSSGSHVKIRGESAAYRNGWCFIYKKTPTKPSYSSSDPENNTVAAFYHPVGVVASEEQP